MLATKKLNEKELSTEQPIKEKDEDDEDEKYESETDS
jgi:hypothetical protein